MGTAAHPPLRRARLRAVAVDEAIVGGITLVLYAMALQTGAAAFYAFLLARLLGLSAADGGWLFALLLVLHWLVIRLAYGVFGDGSPSGQTWGKRRAGLRVLGPEGTPPGYRRAWRRQLARLALVPGLVGLLRGRERLWHDRVAGTLLAPAPPAGPASAADGDLDG